MYYCPENIATATWYSLWQYKYSSHTSRYSKYRYTIQYGNIEWNVRAVQVGTVRYRLLDCIVVWAYDRTQKLSEIRGIYWWPASPAVNHIFDFLDFLLYLCIFCLFYVFIDPSCLLVNFHLRIFWSGILLLELFIEKYSSQVKVRSVKWYCTLYYRAGAAGGLTRCAGWARP